MSSFRPRQFDLIAFDWDGTLFDSTTIITRCIQMAVADVGGQVPTREQASYVIGMALLPALAHAAPDVPKDKYPLLGERYRHHYLAHQHDISLFDGVLDMLSELKARHHWLTVATAKAVQAWTRPCMQWNCAMCSMARARPTRRRASPIRSCSTS